MELVLAATAVFTILQPFINAWINRINWTPKQKTLVAWAVAIVIGAGYVFFTAGIGSWYQLFLAAPLIFGYGQAIHQFLVKNIATKFEAITAKGSAVIAPAENTDNAELVTDKTIDLQGGSVTVEAPVTVKQADTPPPTDPEPLKRDENVVG